MATFLKDTEVVEFLAEPKPVPDDYRTRLQTKLKHGHQERELDVTGAQGTMYRVILRQSLLNPLDFSVILAYLPPQSATPFRLCRYNGKSHEHTNKLEGNTFYDFHIHRTTERYQQSGLREDAFAEPTNRYQDLATALRCLVHDCGFQLPPYDQGELF